ncbi:MULTISPECIES: HlyD family efflux transporter periplasmic adaptor subunit [Variovorax]|jgi:multidrug resistance efflux pump|uniref:HlyD family efflux transporter periplasmic adaptor subunit n=1 Tax=Variovorax TaxID=34072 RepID=UPI000898940C|nr:MULTISPECIES: HlyD family efflux transporter periplasmic adaptor subunit [Variovorax]MDQ0081123.1 multidrug resistance efflux pump [Variovorax boronicumulans]SDX06197.1 HlyD family secretion protein [Variovorax sp. YR634]SEU12271.1 HlyD family secretion protein [Variovorax sp. OV084]SOD28829.1 HlyD family secretion protein [Variovorax sp. YR752]
MRASKPISYLLFRRPARIAGTIDRRARSRPGRSRQRGSFVPKLAAYALLAFVLWLMIATLIQPLLSAQATRAVLEAPVGLVTSPINGVVTQMAVHTRDAVVPGSLVATVRNPTVSQEILTTLTTQRLALQSQLSQLGNQFKADSQEMRSVGQEAQVHRQASLAQTWDAWQIAQRQRDVAHSVVAEQENKVRTNEALLKEGAISEQVMNAAEAQLSTARANAAVAEQAFAGQAQTVVSAGQGAFVGTGGSNLFQTLSSRREALRNSIDRAQQDGTAIFKQLKQITQLEDDERRRVEKLAAYQVTATQPGLVHTVLAPEGAYVTAGASLVRVTDCSRIGVVAVFPARLAKRLSIGSMLDVKIGENSTALPARVEQLLPEASEALQSTYSVPFPYAEQGSIYAVARIEDSGVQQAESRRQSLCVPGKVVSASLKT